MSSWACPHLDPQSNRCRRLDTACVLGRKGCILPRKLSFADYAAEGPRTRNDAASADPDSTVPRNTRSVR